MRLFSLLLRECADFFMDDVTDGTSENPTLVNVDQLKTSGLFPNIEHRLGLLPISQH